MIYLVEINGKPKLVRVVKPGQKVLKEIKEKPNELINIK